MEQVPQIHGQTTTTTTITETHVQTNLRFDPSYIKTIPGILKMVCLGVSLIVFICGVSTSNYYRESTTVQWSFFVSMTAFWVTSILVVMYLFHVTEKFHVIPWSMLEMGFCALMAFFYLTVGIDTAVKAAAAARKSALAALSFFAFVVLCAYAADAYLKYRTWKSGQFVQGERNVQQTQSSAKGVI